jgi:cytochrome c5
MFSRIVSTAAAAFMLTAGTAAAASDKASANQIVASVQGAAGVADKAEDKKICKRFENTVSRARSSKLCLTRSEWKKWQSDQGQ